MAKNCRRWLMVRLAGRLAYLLNRGEKCVELTPSTLEREILADLSRPVYAEGVIGVALMGLADCPERAAERYFEAVLNRPFYLARTNHLHKAHELFLALCQRGRDPIWRWAKLERHNPPPAAASDQPPADFSLVRERLGRHDHSITPGNPAANTRGRSGPLYLIAGGSVCEVPEQMSVWGALSSGPNCLIKLEKRAFDRICSILTKALENADDRYKRLLGLGLSPFDWPEITTNTANKALVFINKVRAFVAESSSGHQDIYVWREVWRDTQVPGFADANAFWASEFGRALRQPQVPHFLSYDEMDGRGVAEDEPEPELQGPEEYEKRIDELQAAGKLEDFDTWFLHRLNEGRKIAELIHSQKSSAYFGHPPGQQEIADYMEDLLRRCHALRLDGRDGEDKDEDD